MAYLTIARISGDPDELLAGYRLSSSEMDQVGRDHGLILHAAAKSDDGLVVVNLWPSEQESESAARDGRRRAQIQRHGLEPGRFRREHFQVANHVIFD